MKAEAMKRNTLSAVQHAGIDDAVCRRNNSLILPWFKAVTFHMSQNLTRMVMLLIDLFKYEHSLGSICRT